MVLLALVNADYKFLWVNMGASGSSSDAQIFNRSKLKRRIENGRLGLPPPEPLGPGGPEVHYFLLGDNAFGLMAWLMKPYSRQLLTREERIANYRISRGRRVVENSFETFHEIRPRITSGYKMYKYKIKHLFVKIHIY